MSSVDRPGESGGLSAVRVLRHAAFRRRQDNEHEETPSARQRFGRDYSSKGNFGEIQMDRWFIDQGCVPVAGTKRVSDLHTGRGTNGIDGLYWSTATARFVAGGERLVVVESKPGRRLPSLNVGPNQMTPDWIRNHLVGSGVDAAAIDAFDAGDYVAVLCNYDDAGNLTLHRLVAETRRGGLRMQRGAAWSPQL